MTFPTTLVLAATLEIFKTILILVKVFFFLQMQFSSEDTNSGVHQNALHTHFFIACLYLILS